MNNPDRVTIGKLSRGANVLPSTVRFYVKQGLLEVVDQTPGGFMLFELNSALERLERIRTLQGQERLTLAEIRERLAGENTKAVEGEQQW